MYDLYKKIVNHRKVIQKMFKLYINSLYKTILALNNTNTYLKYLNIFLITLLYFLIGMNMCLWQRYFNFHETTRVSTTEQMASLN